MTRSYKREQERYHPFRIAVHTTLIALVAVGLFTISEQNYLLFHGLVELFSVAISTAMFMIAWNTRKYTENASFVYLGIAYLFIGGLDLLHTLSYKGTSIFTYQYYANQLWIAARYLEAITLFFFFINVRREPRIPYNAAFIFYAVVTALIVVSIFVVKVFPVCFVEGVGNTPFKKVSEYIISGILLSALFFLVKNRKSIDRRIYFFLLFSIIATIGSELAFTFYISNYGFSNLVGHYFKIVSFYLIYKAVIETGLTTPFSIIFQKLKENEARFRIYFELGLVGMATLSADRRIKEANAHLANLLGYTVENLTMRPLELFAAHDNRGLLEEQFERIAGNKENGFMTEARFMRKDGTHIIAEMSVRAVRDEHASVRLYLLLFNDITARKARERVLADELERKRYSIQKAQELQWNINTRVLPATERIALSALYMPSEELGGDFFTVTKTEDGNLLFLLADCTGHGIEASMDMTLMKAITDRHLALAEESISSFITAINRDMKDYIIPGQYPTLFAAALNTKAMTLTYANANGALPYIVRKNEPFMVPQVMGFHIGFDLTMTYEERTVPLEEGDVLVLFSDALIEAPYANSNVYRNPFKTNELFEGFGNGLTVDMKLLLKKLRVNAGGFPLTDDLTLVMAECVPARMQAFEIHAAYEEADVLHAIRTSLVHAGYEGEARRLFLLALSELIKNALEHGNKYNPAKRVRVEATVTCERVVVSVEDEGEGFNVDDVPDPTDFTRLMRLLDEDRAALYTRGRGIWLSRFYVDDIEYNERGNRVTITQERPPVHTMFRYEGRVPERERRAKPPQS